MTLHHAARLAASLLTVALLGACAAVPEPPASSDACRARPFKATTVPAQLVDGLLVVPAAVNRKPVRLRIDTGANLLLMLWSNAARDLGVQSRAAGLGDTLAGAVAVREGTVATLDLGDLSFADVPTAVLPQRTGTGAEGQLGVLLLETGDLLHGFPFLPTMALIDAEGCQREVLRAMADDRFDVVAVPLTQPFRDIGNGYLFATLEVEGRPLAAMVDTGMTATALTEAGLARVGADRPVRDTVLVRNIDGNTTQGEIHRFTEVAFGPRRARDVDLIVLPDSPLTRRFGIEAFVGSDILFSQPALISLDAGAVFLLLPRAGAGG